MTDYDYLVSRQFLQDGQLYEVVDTFLDRTDDEFKAKCLLIFDSEDVLIQEEDLVLRDWKLEDWWEEKDTRYKGVVTLVKEHMLAGWKDTEGEHTEWPTASEDWVRAQQQDPYCQVLLEKLVTEDDVVFLHEDQSDGDYFFRSKDKDGLLGPVRRRFVERNEFKSQATEISYERPRYQMVVPRALVRMCLYHHHEGLAHPGRTKTMLAVQAGFFWPTIRRDCANYMAQCHYCLRRKQYNQQAQLPIQVYDRPARPFYRLHWDVTGPFRVTESGNKYILVFKCALTKWVEIFAIPQQNAVEVARCFLDEVVMRHGCPHEVVTDRGTENANKLVKEVLQLLNIPRKIKTTAYNPRSDGMVATHMRVLKDQLASYVDKFQSDWDEHLGVVAGAYRMTVNEATGYSPFYLIYGREAEMPCENHIDEMRKREGLSEYVQNLTKALAHTWESVSERAITNVAAYNKRPREPLHFKPYAKGEYFMLRKRPIRFYINKKTKQRAKLVAKLQHRWVGPYRILSVISPVLYEASIHGKRRRVHAVNMKPKTENWMKGESDKKFHAKQAGKNWILKHTVELEELYAKFRKGTPVAGKKFITKDDSSDSEGEWFGGVYEGRK